MTELVALAGQLADKQFKPTHGEIPPLESSGWSGFGAG
jgi:hypothetical protein